MTDLDEKLAELQAAREARKAKAENASKEQLVVDLGFIDAFEEELGATNVAVLRVPFVEEGLPVAVAVRCPKSVEMKRYRDRLKGDAKKADTVKAAEEVGATCLVYPDKAILDRLAEHRPGVKAQLGLAALELSVAVAEAEGKD